MHVLAQRWVKRWHQPAAFVPLGWAAAALPLALFTLRVSVSLNQLGGGVDGGGGLARGGWGRLVVLAASRMTFFIYSLETIQTRGHNLHRRRAAAGGRPALGGAGRAHVPGSAHAWCVTWILLRRIDPINKNHSLFMRGFFFGPLDQRRCGFSHRRMNPAVAPPPTGRPKPPSALKPPSLAKPFSLFAAPL